MYCSPNVPRRDALKYSYICGMSISDNLGTYLGFPLVHGRLKKDHFKATIDKVQKKLSGWKTNLLSFAARCTLIQAVSSTIPNYGMQTTKFPTYICKELDKLNRNFLWGDTVNKKKVHLVKWDTVCQPKIYGGLGIRNSIDNNLAINTKLGWEIMTGPNTPWVKLMRSKYGCGSNPRHWARKARPSHIWKAIYNTKDILTKNTKWTVGNGQCIDMGLDWWCGRGPIRDTLTITNDNISGNVSNLIFGNGTWNMNLVQNMFSHDWVEAINSTPLPIYSVLQDSPSWTGTGSGKFLISSCYKNIFDANIPDNTIEVNWKWIWKLKLPQRIITFLWLVKQGKILTNTACVNMNITQNPNCGLCGQIETIDHIFRSCSFAINTWNLITGALNWCNLGTSFNDWLDINAKVDGKKFNMDIPWGTIFSSAIWLLWKTRNNRHFNNVNMDYNQVATRSLKFAVEIFNAYNRTNVVSAANHDLIKWNFPCSSTIKINSDGSTFGNYGWAAYGGLARDDQGRWIDGFCGRIGYGTPLQAKLWGIRRAMKLANKRAWLQATIETNSLTAVNLINKEDDANHPDKTLIQDCKKLKEAQRLEVIHVRREGNKCADYMSKLGRVQGEQYMRVLVPSNELVQLLKADMQGVAYPRGV